MIRSRLLSVISIVLVLAMMLAGAALAQETTPVPEEPASYVGIYFDEITLSITRVIANSPAEEAGLQEGDVLVALDGTSVTEDTLINTIRSYAAGDTVVFTVERDGETLQVDVVLGTVPIDIAGMIPPVQNRLRDRLQQFDQAFLGIQLSEADGVVSVVGVVSGSAAEEAGLLEGDVIREVDGETVESAADLTAIVQAAVPGDTIALTVERAGETLEISAVLTARRVMDLPSVIEAMPSPIDTGLVIAYLPEEGVWEIQELSDEHPLAEAGLQAGDRITAVDGATLELNNMRGVMFNLRRDGNVTLTVERGVETLEVDVSASALMEMMFMGAMRGFGRNMPGMEMMPPMGRGNMPDFNLPSPRGGQHGGHFFHRHMHPVRLGVAFLTLDEQAASANDLNVTDGALLLEVEAGSPADEAGLLEGDVIVSVDGDMLDGRHTLVARLYPYRPGDTVTLAVLRDGETLEIEVILGHPIQRMWMTPPTVEAEPGTDA